MYYYTIKEINVATAILLQYMAPLLVLAYAAIAKEEELTLTKVAAGFVSLLGCYLALNRGNLPFQSLSTLGLMTGILSAFCWGFANVWMRHLVQRYSVWTMLIYSFSFASVFWLFFNPPWNILTAHYSVNEWGTYFLFAMMSVLIPHSFYYSGIQYLTASQAIITATAEPIVAIISAFFVLGETLSTLQLIGATLVLTAIGLLQFKRDVTTEILATESEK
jgi:drug/metabolite transporter (DMT)-like permease